MKNLVHCFSREVVAQFLNSRAINHGKNFEFLAALLMQRMYEKQWNVATMICFNLKTKYHDAFVKTPSPTLDFMMEALGDGIEENNPIDFVIAAADDSAFQEFQLKRFGLNGEESTDALIDYINEMKAKYAPLNAACVVALANFGAIDLPKVGREIEKKDFPFKELLFVGVENNQAFVVGMLPAEGWSAFDLSKLVN
jgi:hypothetical protein